jgi:ankyrin repeat protein
MNFSLSQQLVEACEKGDCEAVRELLAQGAKCNSATLGGALPLLRVAARNHARCFAALLEHGVHVNKSNQSTGLAALHWASRTGSVDMVRALLAADANVRATDRRGFTALHFAAYEGKTKCLRALIECGVDVDIDARQDDGDTPLHFAALRGTRRCALALLKAGATADARNRYAKTPLDYAVRTHNNELAWLLDVGMYRRFTLSLTLQQRCFMIARRQHDADALAQMLPPIVVDNLLHWFDALSYPSKTNKIRFD